MPSASKGYVWTDFKQTDVDVITSKAENLVGEIPVWNASASAAQVKVRLQVNDVTDPTNVLVLRESNLLTLPGVIVGSDAGKKANLVTLTIPLTEVRKLTLAKDGRQPISISGMLYDSSGTMLDFWSVDANLNLGPEIKSITPSTQEMRKTVVVTGSGFGTHDGSVNLPGKLLVAGQTVGRSGIVLWTDSQIEFTVPYGAPSNSDVTVTVVGMTSNLKNLVVTVPKYPSGNYELRQYSTVVDPDSGESWWNWSVYMTVSADGTVQIGGNIPITTLYGSGTVAPNTNRLAWNEAFYLYTGLKCIVPNWWCGPKGGACVLGNYDVTYTDDVFKGTAVRPDKSSFPVSIVVKVLGYN